MHSFEHMLLRPKKNMQIILGLLLVFLSGFETYRLCFQNPTYSFWWYYNLGFMIIFRAGNPRFYQSMLDEDMIRRVTIGLFRLDPPNLSV